MITQVKVKKLLSKLCFWFSCIQEHIHQSHKKRVGRIQQNIELVSERKYFLSSNLKFNIAGRFYYFNLILLYNNYYLTGYSSYDKPIVIFLKIQ